MFKQQVDYPLFFSKLTKFVSLISWQKFRVSIYSREKSLFVQIAGSEFV